MSELITGTAVIKDLHALRAAINTLGLTLQEGGRARYYHGESDPCDYVIPLPGRYDIGFCSRPDGAFEIVGDSDIFNGVNNSLTQDATQHLGPKLGRLLQQYSLQVLTKQAMLKGASVSRHMLENGFLKITLHDGGAR